MLRTSDLVGLVLDDRYELRAVLGEGTFGRVYRGYDRRLERAVAVKVIKPWWGEDPEWVESFQQEARLLARVSDPGIVQIFDVGHADEGLYYVAELVEGESLAGVLERGPVPSDRAREIAEQLCRALAHAHEQRVVHRDVKPANVLISAQGRLKVGDFGVARLAQGTSEVAAGTVVGTPRYMAPEQARGGRTTPATDVYGVGVVLYEMLSGHPPFAGRSAVELALRHANDPPPPLPGRVPASLVQIVDRALAKDPLRRYRDGAEMAAALAAAPLRTEPVEFGASERSAATLPAPRMTPRRTSNPSARRRTIAMFALALLVLAGLIAGALVLPGTAVRVPDVHGLSRATIAGRTRHLGLRARFGVRYSAARLGTAIAQRPAAGVSLAAGSLVLVTLSAGPRPVKVPKLIGVDAGAARQVLSSLGLRPVLSLVPAPGIRPGTVTAQTPGGNRYVAAGRRVALAVSEVPRWRALTSVAGSGGAASVPFRVRGVRWRVRYRMGYVGLCTFIVFCQGPTAEVLDVSHRKVVARFDLSDGGRQTRVFDAGPGVFQVRVAPGQDTARFTVDVQDDY